MRPFVCLALALMAAPSSGAAFAEPPAAAKKAATIHGEVVHVFDGDSFVMKSGSRKIEVRVFGIDAPERYQPWSDRARSRARDLLLGEDVRVLVERGKDPHGRVVGDVRLDGGRSFAGVMVGEGLAWHYTRYSKDAEIAALERAARSAHRGLWSEEDPEPPWIFRRHAPSRGKQKGRLRARADIAQRSRAAEECARLQYLTGRICMHSSAALEQL